MDLQGISELPKESPENQKPTWLEQDDNLLPPSTGERPPQRTFLLSGIPSMIPVVLFLTVFAAEALRNPPSSRYYLLQTMSSMHNECWNHRLTLPNLDTATLEDLTLALRCGAVTSHTLVRTYLARIEEVKQELRAIIEINPYALDEAEQLDAYRMNGRPLRGSLHGIPILLKDNIATARLDQTYMNTTAGSYALLGSFRPRDSTIAAKLKAAGAIILGNTNLSVWSNRRSMNGTQGWSPRVGQCTAAYVKHQDPSGSSSGSAVAASVGLAVAAIGTDTRGSISDPAQKSNLCAIKPTIGLVSRDLVIPISQTHDTIGPMARDCKTAAAILGVIAGKDMFEDPATARIPFDTIPDYVKACTKDGLKGARIGVPTEYITTGNLNTPVLAAFNKTFDIIRRLGASVHLRTDFPAAQAYYDNPSEEVVLDIDFVHNLKQYFSKLYINPSNITNLGDMFEYTKKDTREGFPNRNIDTWQRALGRNLTQQSPAYLRALSNSTYIGSTGTILGALERYDLDAIIIPTDLHRIAAPAGYPVITLPLGFYPDGTDVVWNDRRSLVMQAPGMPFGISFLGRPFSEEKLIAYACAFEAATQFRKRGPRPYIVGHALSLPTLELA